MTEASEPRRKFRPGRGLATGLIVLIAVALILLVTAWLARRPLAQATISTWLERQGLDAQVDIQRVDLDGMHARIRIGDPRDPDLVVERVEIDYALAAPWATGGAGATPSRIRLLRPVVKARWQDGKLSFGSLDPLIKRFTSAPPRDGAAGPLVLVEQGQARIRTEFGTFQVLADARIDKGRLIRLAASLPAVDARGRNSSATGLTGRLEATGTDNRLSVKVSFAAEKAAWATGSADRVQATIDGDLPYPRGSERLKDDPLTLRTTLVSNRLALGEGNAAQRLALGEGNAAQHLALSWILDGTITGWIDTFALSGRSQTRMDIDGLEGVTAARGLRATADDGRLAIARDAAGFTLTQTGPLAISARSAEVQGLLLTNALARTQMAVSIKDGWRLGLTGGLTVARASWPLFGPRAADDVPELAAMKRALGQFSLTVPAFALDAASDRTRLTLTRAASATPASGGQVVISPVATPLFQSVGGAPGGAFDLRLRRGSGLPEGRFAVSRWRLLPDGFDARLAGSAALHFGIARGLDVRTTGLLSSQNDRLAYAPAGCVGLEVDQLELGENDVTKVRGQLCPTARPFFALSDGRWRLDGGFAGLSAQAPFLAMAVTGADGQVTATSGASGLGLTAQVSDATVSDTTAPARFFPMSLSGRVGLQSDRWTGNFDMARNGTALAALALAHDGRREVGGLTIDAPSILFSPDGLQPADLSPLAEPVGSPAQGQATFTGRFDWSADGTLTSGGRLTIPSLDFNSPLGPVKGLAGTVDFVSLTPLITAPDQMLTVRAVQSVAALSDARLTFGLDERMLAVGGAEIAVGGGTVSLEPLSVPLDPKAPTTGILVLDKVQIGDVLATSGFGDKVKLDAVVSGRLPFTWTQGTGLRITGGSLSAVQPGRLSIAREALSGLEAGGGGSEIAPNTVEDLAYQAMENLAFDLLSAEVNSLDAGRLGVLFRIRGRHDPPQQQELRVSIQDFISRAFLNRKLPLPSDTGIDLTLDTTLNVDQLVSDLLALDRARNGGP